MGGFCHKKTQNAVDKAMYENSVDAKMKQSRQSKYLNLSKEEKATKPTSPNNPLTTSPNKNSLTLDYNKTSQLSNGGTPDEPLDHIDVNDFIIKKQLGKGSFGQVYLVEHKQTAKEYAMKILLKEKLKENDLVENSKVERIILSKLSFPFIVDMTYSFQSSTKLFLVTEFVPGGDLHDLLKRFKAFKPEMIRLYIAEILLSLEYLHQNHCIYRDLKPENVLIAGDGHIKIIDFNLSKLFLSKNNSIQSLKAESICGTADYMAPEIVNQNDYNYLVDWFSLGVLTYTFFTGFTPFNCKKNPLDTEIKKKAVYFNKDVFDALSEDFVRKLLSYDPLKRLGAKGVAEIKEHAFFADIDWGKVLRKEYEPLYIPPIFNRDSTVEYGTKNNVSGEFSEIPNTVTNTTLEEKGNVNAKRKNKGTYEGFTYIKDYDM